MWEEGRALFLFNLSIMLERAYVIYHRAVLEKIRYIGGNLNTKLGKGKQKWEPGKDGCTSAAELGSPCGLPAGAQELCTGQGLFSASLYPQRLLG